MKITMIWLVYGTKMVTTLENMMLRSPTLRYINVNKFYGVISGPGICVLGFPTAVKMQSHLS